MQIFIYNIKVDNLTDKGKLYVREGGCEELVVNKWDFDTSTLPVIQYDENERWLPRDQVICLESGYNLIQ